MTMEQPNIRMAAPLEPLEPAPITANYVPGPYDHAYAPKGNPYKTPHGYIPLPPYHSTESSEERFSVGQHFDGPYLPPVHGHMPLNGYVSNTTYSVANHAPTPLHQGAEPSRKRQRADSNPIVAPTRYILPPPVFPALSSSVRGLSTEWVQNILIEAAQRDPWVADRVYQIRRWETELESSRIKDEAARERTRVIDFRRYSQAVSTEIDCEYGSGSAAYEAAFKVRDFILEVVKSIPSCVKLESSFETKANALKTLYKIAKTICLAKGPVAHEVRKKFHSDDMEDNMFRIVECMDVEERETMLQTDDGEGGDFGFKLLKLEELANDYCIMAGLRKVRKALEAEKYDDSEEEGSEDKESVYEKHYEDWRVHVPDDERPDR